MKDGSTTKLIKWSSNLLVICAATSLSLGYPSVSQFLFFCGSIGWLITGLIWREPSVWTLNLVLASIYIAGMI